MALKRADAEACESRSPPFGGLSCNFNLMSKPREKKKTPNKGKPSGKTTPHVKQEIEDKAGTKSADAKRPTTPKTQEQIDAQNASSLATALKSDLMDPVEVEDYLYDLVGTMGVTDEQLDLLKKCNKAHIALLSA